MTPDDRRYTHTHQWIKIEGHRATVGISDHAQQALGDITFVELPEPGSVFAAGSECGVIESVKAASDLYAPLSGTIAEINAELDKHPEIINEDPYGRGWMFRIEGVPLHEAEDLLDADGYETLLRQEEEE